MSTESPYLYFFKLQNITEESFFRIPFLLHIDDYFKQIRNSTQNSTDIYYPPSQIKRSTDGTVGFITNLTISIGVLLLTFLLFIFLRHFERRFYRTKAFLKERFDWAPQLNQGAGWFDWLKVIFNWPEDIIMKSPGGIDFAMYISFITYCTLQFFFMSFVGLVILIPVNFSGKNKDLDPSNPEWAPPGVDRLSIVNISQGNRILWIHVLIVILFSAATYYFIYKLLHNYEDYSHKRNKKDNFRTKTVMVRDIPDEYAHNDETLLRFFQNIYGERAVFAKIIPKVETLSALSEERKVLIDKLMDCNDIYVKTKKRPYLRTGCLPFIGTKVDSINYYKDKIAALNEEITVAQHTLKENSRTAFVTFDNVLSAQQCAQCLHLPNPLTMSVRPAPQIRDINWKWIVTPDWQLTIRKICVMIVFVLFFFFWSIPVTLVSGFSSLDSLSNLGLVSLVNIIKSNTYIQGLIEGFLPSLALNIFFTILPYLLALILNQWGSLRQSDYLRSLFDLYWLFLFLNFFLLSAITSSIFNIIFDLIQTPESILVLIARTLPSQAIYFANYILFQGYAIYPIFYLCRIDEYLICKIRHIFTCKTERSRIAAEQPDPIERFIFSVLYSREVLVFCIALIYSTMTPLILPFAASYFAIAYVIHRYNIVFVYMPQFEGIRMTPLAVWRMLYGVITYQIIMMGIFLVKIFPDGSVACLILLFFSLAYMWWLNRRFYSNLKHALPLSLCPKSVSQDLRASLGTSDKVYKYLPPSLLPIHHPLQAQSIPVSKGKGWMLTHEDLLGTLQELEGYWRDNSSLSLRNFPIPSKENLSKGTVELTEDEESNAKTKLEDDEV